VSINLFENSIHCPPEFIGFFQVHRNLGSQIVFDYWCGLLYANLAQNKPHSTKASLAKGKRRHWKEQLGAKL